MLSLWATCCVNRRTRDVATPEERPATYLTRGASNKSQEHVGIEQTLFFLTSGNISEANGNCVKDLPFF